MSFHKSNADSTKRYEELFCELMIEKIKSLSVNWHQPWFSTRSTSLPQSVSGRSYNGMNAVMLYLLCEKFQYQMPAFMTFNQANEMGVRINKGAKSFPVVFWNRRCRDTLSGKSFPIDVYDNLSKEEKKNYETYAVLVSHNVFNIEQTNLSEVKPDLFAYLCNKFNTGEVVHKEGLFAHPPIDEMIAKQGWLCPINVQKQDNAYYERKSDCVNVPLKDQFLSGEAFYSTLLHEMTHSTGSPDRLNREKGVVFGDEKYAREELVAELTSAMLCQQMGIYKEIQEENAAYLKAWLGEISKSPNFLLSVLSDVNKAAKMITEVVQTFDEDLERDVKEDIAQQKALAEAEKENSLIADSRFVLNGLGPSIPEEAPTRFQYSPSLPEGEFALVERRFSEKAGMNFTGNDRIHSAADIAYLFRKLEDSSVENAFVVYHRRNAPAVIQYISTGTESITLLPVSPVIQGALRTRAESVTFVHNHPSGEVRPSLQDKNILNKLSVALSERGIRINGGVIINTVSGHYSTFNDSSVEEKQRPSSAEREIPYNVLAFDKLVFSKDYVPEKLTKIDDSESVAKFLSSHRLGERDKVNFLALDLHLRVVGNFFTDETKVDRTNFRRIASNMVDTAYLYGAAAIVPYGRFDYDKGIAFTEAVSKASGDSIKLLDVVLQDKLDTSQFVSLSDSGLLKDGHERYGGLKAERREEGGSTSFRITDAMLSHVGSSTVPLTLCESGDGKRDLCLNMYALKGELDRSAVMDIYLRQSDLERLQDRTLLLTQDNKVTNHLGEPVGKTQRVNVAQRIYGIQTEHYGERVGAVFPEREGFKITINPTKVQGLNASDDGRLFLSVKRTAGDEYGLFPTKALYSNRLTDVAHFCVSKPLLLSLGRSSFRLNDEGNLLHEGRVIGVPMKYPMRYIEHPSPGVQQGQRDAFSPSLVDVSQSKLHHKSKKKGWAL